MSRKRDADLVAAFLADEISSVELTRRTIARDFATGEYNHFAGQPPKRHKFDQAKYDKAYALFRRPEVQLELEI